jgi:hypothetical protein
MGNMHDVKKPEEDFFSVSLQQFVVCHNCERTIPNMKLVYFLKNKFAKRYFCGKKCLDKWVRGNGV